MFSSLGLFSIADYTSLLLKPGRRNLIPAFPSHPAPFLSVSFHLSRSRLNLPSAGISLCRQTRFLSQVFERGCVQGHGQLNPVHRLNAIAYLPDLISMKKLQRHFPFLRVGPGTWRSAPFLAIQIRLRGATLRSRSEKLVLNVQEFWRSVSEFQPKTFPLNQNL